MTQSPEPDDPAAMINIVFAEFIVLNNLMFKRRLRNLLPTPRSVRAMRYEAFHGTLIKLDARLDAIVNELRDELRRERAMRRYAGLLRDAIRALMTICDKRSRHMRDAASGYDEADYQADLDRYHELVEHYRKESGKINAFLARTPR